MARAGDGRGEGKGRGACRHVKTAFLGDDWCGSEADGLASWGLGVLGFAGSWVGEWKEQKEKRKKLKREEPKGIGRRRRRRRRRRRSSRSTDLRDNHTDKHQTRMSMSPTERRLLGVTTVICHVLGEPIPSGFGYGPALAS